jgi:diaminopimelate decarboxylase
MSSDLAHPARTRLAPPSAVGACARNIDMTDLPLLLSRLRSLSPRIAIACPAEALLAPETAHWVRRHGLTVAAYSSDQLALAISSGIQPKRIVMHGDGSKWGPIRCACNAEVRQFVVNAVAQVPVLAYYSRRGQQVVLDVGADQFEGGDDVNDAIAAICESDRLELVGFHCRMDARATVTPREYGAAIDTMVARMARILRSRRIIPCSLSLAGPLGDSPSAISAVIEAATEEACARWHYPRPRLAFTPQLS